MRETFRGYYRPTDEEFKNLWKNCIFCFDANILLNIYRYSPETREKFMRILKEVSNRTIIPYQAAEEYQNNRLKVIKDQEDAYDKIITQLRTNFDQIEKSLNAFKKHPLINVKSIVNDLDNTYKPIQSDLKEKQKNHPNLFDKDDLREEITALLDGKISDPCPIDQMTKIEKEVERRYENKIPPGYKDYIKEENNWGDLILWFQILKIAKDEELPIIFVTDDKKEDWWWIFKGKTIGPRQELIEEMYNSANVQFYMYKTDQFIEFAEKELFEQSADPEFIKEVKDVLIKDIDWDNITESKYSELEFKIAPKSDSKLRDMDSSLFYEVHKIKEKLDEIENGKYFSKDDLNKLKKGINRVTQDFEEYELFLQEKFSILKHEHLNKTLELERINEKLNDNDITGSQIDYYLKKRISLITDIEELNIELENINNIQYSLQKKIKNLNNRLYKLKRSRLNFNKL